MKTDRNQQHESIEQETTEAQENSKKGKDPEQAEQGLPPGETAHPRSHAAHLHSHGKADSKPEGNLRQGSHPGGRRQP